MIMVKPALPYLDVLATSQQRSMFPSRPIRCPVSSR